MKYMDYDSGVADGRQAVEEDAEFNMTVADYEADLSSDIKEYKRDATRGEKKEYRAGYMAGVRQQLEELEERAPAEAEV